MRSPAHGVRQQATSTSSPPPFSSPSHTVTSIRRPVSHSSSQFSIAFSVLAIAQQLTLVLRHPPPVAPPGVSGRSFNIRSRRHRLSMSPVQRRITVDAPNHATPGYQSPGIARRLRSRFRDQHQAHRQFAQLNRRHRNGQARRSLRAHSHRPHTASPSAAPRFASAGVHFYSPLRLSMIVVINASRLRQPAYDRRVK